MDQRRSNPLFQTLERWFVSLLMQKELIIVSTPLPPRPCGIGGYTAMLGRHWPRETRVIHLVDAEAEESSRHLGLKDILQMERTRSSMLSQLEKFPKADVLLQYAGRGYDRYGCPFWMLVALKQWKKKHPQQKLAVFFHELWGKVPWTNKLIITETASRWLSGRLAKLADVVLTNTPHHAARLQEAFGMAHMDCVPVGANITPDGQPLLPFQQRKQGDFAVLTAPYGRVQMFRQMGDTLRTLCDKGLLQCLHIIGPSDPRWAAQEQELLGACLPADRVKVHGILPVEEVSRQLNSCAFALLAQPVESLMKSTAFMAFASHQNAVVNPFADDSPTEPQRYLVSPGALWNRAGESGYFAEQAAGLHGWYQEHASWERIAARLAAACEVK